MTGGAPVDRVDHGFGPEVPAGDQLADDPVGGLSLDLVMAEAGAASARHVAAHDAFAQARLVGLIDDAAVSAIPA